MEHRYGIIYGLVDPVTMELRYIGQTIRKERTRLNRHMSDSKNEQTHCARWLRSLKERPIMIEIEQSHSRNLDELEAYYIIMFRDLGYNLTNIASGGRSNHNISPETRVKISNALKGVKKTKEAIEKTAIGLRKYYENAENKKVLSDRAKMLYATGVWNNVGNKYNLGRPSHLKGKKFPNKIVRNKIPPDKEALIVEEYKKGVPYKEIMVKYFIKAESTIIKIAERNNLPKRYQFHKK